MNASQLKRAIDSNPCIRPSFRGVFSRDTLPHRVERYPCVYVVNTDVSYRPGQHWVAIILRNSSYGVFFDSFGRTPEEWGREFKDFMDFHVYRYDHFDVQIQSIDSSYCGLFVLAFIFLTVCASLSMDQFKSLFDANVYKNDEIVYSFVCHYFDL